MSRLEIHVGGTLEDMKRRVPDITKIKTSIGWAPENTLDNIIDDVAAEMKK